MHLLRFSALLLFFTYSIFGYANNKQTYVVGTEDVEYYPHYGKKAPKSIEFSGYAREFFDDFSRQYLLNISYQPQPIKRLYLNLLVSKSIDFKYPDNPNWGQEVKLNQTVYYSVPISYYTDGVFVHQDNKNMPFSNIKELGILRGFTPELLMENLELYKTKIRYFSRTSHMLLALKAKSIDAIYVNTDVAFYQIKLLNIPSLIFKSSFPHKTGSYHLSTVKHPHILRKFNKYIEENSEAIGRLRSKYGLSLPNATQ